MQLLTSIASLLVVATTGCVMTETDSSLLVQNRSDFEIHEMYVTEVQSPTWGPNLLDREILYPGESMLLGVECGTYDAMLIDETGLACEVSNIDLCYDDADWIIRNSSCAVFEARAKAMADAAASSQAK